MNVEYKITSNCSFDEFEFQQENFILKNNKNFLVEIEYLNKNKIIELIYTKVNKKLNFR